MRFHIANTRIPELLAFDPKARRFLRKCARQALFAQRPWLRWAPLVLTFVGAASGFSVTGLLPRPSVESGVQFPTMIVPTLVFYAGAAVGLFVGLSLHSFWIRPHIRRLIA